MRVSICHLLLCSAIVSCTSAHRQDSVDEDVPVRTAVDRDCDGVVDRCDTLDPVADGSRFGIDQDCDGVPDVDCTTERYDGESITARSFDANCDGAPGGVPVVLESIGACFGGERVAPGHDTYFWDEDCDGVPENCTDYRFDTQGRETSRTFDEGCDGSGDTCNATIYDATGFGREESDMGCDGTVESVTCRRLIRDAEGKVTSDASDTDCDGTPDSWCLERSYGFGIQLTETRDSDCDGVPEMCQSAVMRNDGNNTIVTSGWGACDGIPDGSCFVLWIDADGNRTAGHSDGDCDGPLPPQDCRASSYDVHGREIGRTRDNACDGVPDSCETSVYE